MRKDRKPASDKTEAAPEVDGLRLSVSEVNTEEASSVDESGAVETRSGFGHQSRARLMRALFVKGLLELCFVAALAFASHYTLFRPSSMSGAFDQVGAHAASGWVFDRAAPDNPVEVHVYVGGIFVAGGLADQPRPDLVSAGRAPHERVGFHFRFEPGLARRGDARIYAVITDASGNRRTLRQIGDTLRTEIE